MDVDSPHTTHSAPLDAAPPDTPLPEAIARLRAVLDDDPHDLDALGRLGDAQLADHDPDGALLTATTAIGLDPDWELPHRQASIACSRPITARRVSSIAISRALCGASPRRARPRSKASGSSRGDEASTRSSPRQTDGLIPRTPRTAWGPTRPTTPDPSPAEGTRTDEPP